MKKLFIFNLVFLREQKFVILVKMVLQKYDYVNKRQERYNIIRFLRFFVYLVELAKE